MYKCELSKKCILLWNLDGKSPGSHHYGPLGWINGKTVRDWPFILTFLYLEHKHLLKATAYVYTQPGIFTQIFFNIFPEITDVVSSVWENSRTLLKLWSTNSGCQKGLCEGLTRHTYLTHHYYYKSNIYTNTQPNSEIEWEVDIQLIFLSTVTNP